MNKRAYIQRSINGLRRLDGDSVQNVRIKDSRGIADGLTDQFTITVNNTGGTAANVALLSGHYDTETFHAEEDGGDIVVEKHCWDASQLVRAGYPVTAVADDGTFTGGGKTLVFSTPNSTQTIRSFHNYMRMNPRPLKGLQIIANSGGAACWQCDLTVTASSPFNVPQQKTIHLSDFFSAYQYQDDRVNIDFTENELEISDITMLFAIIPNGCSMSFIMKF